MKNKSLPLFETISLLINGNYGLISILIIGIGVFISGGLIREIDFVATYKLQGEVKTTAGTITDIIETNYSINEEYVYANYYEFKSPVGELNWASYSTGLVHKIGDEVIVEYNPTHPEINRIQGLTNSPGGRGIILYLIPLLVGLIWFTINIFKGRAKLNILKNGKITDAQLTNKTATNLKINDRTVYKMRFNFKDSKGMERELKIKTHLPHKLEDDKFEKVIYHSDDPNKAILVDSLPWTVPNYIKSNFI